MAAYCSLCRLPLKCLCSPFEPVSAHSCTLTGGSTLVRERVVRWEVGVGGLPHLAEKGGRLLWLLYGL